TAPHWWTSVGHANVTSADGAFGTAKVYKSRKGEFLFSIGDLPDDEIYIYFPSEKLVGIPNRSAFTFMPFVAFCRDESVATVRSNDKIKVETDMNVVANDKRVEFTTFRGNRIKADLSNF